MEYRASESESDRVELRRCAHSVEVPSIKVAARAERPRRGSELAAGVLRGGSAEGGGGGDDDDDEGGSAMVSAGEMIEFRDSQGNELRGMYSAQ